MKEATGKGRAPKRRARKARPGSARADAVLYRRDALLAWITLNRPEWKNALSGTMREDLLARIREAAGDARVRCLILTGAGDAFCAGGDLEVMAAMKHSGEGFEALGRLMDLGSQIVTTLQMLPKPSLASINGVAAGAGCNLALACDVRIASRTARLGETFTRVGLHPDWGGTYFLPRLVGPSRALELFATGEMIPAQQAFTLGLISRLAVPSRLAAETRALALRLAAAPPRAYTSAREAVRRSLTSSLSAMLSFERQAQRLCWESKDSAEGIQAFLGRRSPRFTGD